MAYMQKYPTSTKVLDLLSSAAIPSINTVIVEGDPLGQGDDQFAWPPPSARPIGLSRQTRK